MVNRGVDVLAVEGNSSYGNNLCRNGHIGRLDDMARRQWLAKDTAGGQ
jgi:hypothetical protein